MPDYFRKRWRQDLVVAADTEVDVPGTLAGWAHDPEWVRAASALAPRDVTPDGAGYL